MPNEDGYHVGAPNVADRQGFIDLVNQVLDRNWLTNDGPLVREFEAAIASYLDVKHCVAMSNGTVAAMVLARALGITGEVIVPAYTFVATAHALEWSGLTAVFADINPATHTLSPESVESAISPRTSAICPVHLWGNICDIPALSEIADRHKLTLFFDAAHAFGCSTNGTFVGGNGDAEVLSFHATKFFQTIEGGAITTNRDDVAAECRSMRNFGFAGYDNVTQLGMNAKLSEVNAAMGLSNLSQIDNLLEANRNAYYLYVRAFEGKSFGQIQKRGPELQSNHQYVVLELSRDASEHRDKIVSELHLRRIFARKYFWPGCHKLAPYNHNTKCTPVPLNNTDDVASRVIVLPTGPQVDKSLPREIVSIVESVV